MECTPGHAGRCQNARYPPCTCRCDGVNHGSGHGRTFSQLRAQPRQARPRRIKKRDGQLALPLNIQLKEEEDHETVDTFTD